MKPLVSDKYAYAYGYLQSTIEHAQQMLTYIRKQDDLKTKDYFIEQLMDEIAIRLHDAEQKILSENAE